ncbi:hypothetical protein BKA56DRAFT_539060 [Ilyonectria sp. MPI-CAGE-AT-0026]|nr:hypothetical protein BKA56DRAFT_539060 [Ilyonectria sp. MPI-CAGE-AT-0026]
METETHGQHDPAGLLTPADTSNSQKAQKKPWVRYRVEYRQRLTNELLRQEESENFHVEHEASEEIHEPIFELITTFKTRVAETATANSDQIAAPAMAPPTHHINIYSLALINAIQSVVKYYPSQDLTGDVLTIQSPYAVLVHHYEELAKFGQDCASQEAIELCVRERDAEEHIGLLLGFLDEHIMPEVRAEQERNRNGITTFAYRWVTYKPGSTIMSSFTGETDWAAEVVHSVEGGTFDNPPGEWEIQLWSLSCNGQWLGRTSRKATMRKNEGEVAMTKSFFIVVGNDLSRTEDEGLDEIVSTQFAYGKKYWSLLGKHCQYYKGQSGEFPYNEVDGLVMADLKSYFSTSRREKPTLMDASDLRNWITNCSCSVCTKRKDTKSTQIVPMFDGYNYIPISTRGSSLSKHHYLICQQHIKAFIFGSRRWERLHVRNFQEPSFDEGMINSLVMHEARKDILKALSKSFARRNKHDKVVPGDMWSADFVKGKGSGLIFLLHGKPGVGKTCTAECIAAFTKRPLMMLTPSDIGTTVEAVEANLTKNFKTARSWGAVLLIDEADVFMERRTASDLVRNSLVAGQVGAFDDAFISRVHVQLYYPEFTDEQRQKVWKTFIDKLAREKGESMRLNIDAKEYIRGTEMRAMKWNGREIRNAFQTAVALAEYEAETDEEGKTIVNDTHFRSVVELSSDFKSYLDKLHGADESERAHENHERLDAFLTADKAN